MSGTRSTDNSDSDDPARAGSTRPSSEAETKQRIDGVEPERRLPDIPGVVLTGELGRGGMGVVYCGRQVKLGRTVAVKTLGVDYRGGAIERRFLNEGKNQARLDHPNVVVCHDSGTTRAGEPYLVLEYVGGPNLLEWIKEHEQLELVDALNLVLVLSRALEHGLERNLVHRDVKPENVLLKPDTHARSKAFPFVPKLADFGLSRSEDVGASGRLTQQGEVWGSPQTMAPEQFDGFADVDHRADIYALGCVLHHVLTGKSAFRATTLAEIKKRKRDGPVPDPRELVPGLHAQTADLVVAMLAIEPDKRPHGYPALEERITGILEELQPRARVEEARRKRFLVRVVLPLLVLTIAAVTWAIVRGRPVNGPPPNVAPIFTALRGPLRVDAGTVNELVAEASDPEGGAVTFEWNFDGPFWWKAPASGASPTSRTVRCPEPMDPGDYEIVARVRAVDAEGLASPEKELRLAVIADDKGRPLKAPVQLSGEDEALFAKLWKFNGKGFELDDLGRIWGRSTGNDAWMTTVLPRGLFVFSGRITVERGDARRRAQLFLKFARSEGRTRSIKIYPAERTSYLGIDAVGFDTDPSASIGEEQPIDLVVTWDGAVLGVQAKTVVEIPSDPSAEPPSTQPKVRIEDLFEVKANDGQRPETLTIEVTGGDFFLENLQLAPFSPR